MHVLPFSLSLLPLFYILVGLPFKMVVGGYMVTILHRIHNKDTMNNSLMRALPMKVKRNNLKVCKYTCIYVSQNVFLPNSACWNYAETRDNCSLNPRSVCVSMPSWEMKYPGYYSRFFPLFWLIYVPTERQMCGVLCQPCAPPEPRSLTCPGTCSSRWAEESGASGRGPDPRWNTRGGPTSFPPSCTQKPIRNPSTVLRLWGPWHGQDTVSQAKQSQVSKAQRKN